MFSQKQKFAKSEKEIRSVPIEGRKGFKGFLPQVDEIYFTTAKKKILEFYE
jgi:hypothetical protein